LAGTGQSRFRRGIITHQLLQFLPGLAAEARIHSAHDFVNHFAKDLAPGIRESIVSEVMTILEHPEFRPLFGPGSRAEVAISGLLPDGRVISGQIDRLLVTDTHIMIIDYKTNRPPPLSADAAPPAYRRQLEAYAEALRQIYPGRQIRAALLWTDGPVLMPLI
jgi:ATP-dependent helicase/nuclease subunit A